MAAGSGPSTTPRPRSPATSTANSTASAPSTRSRSGRYPRCRAPATPAPEVSCDVPYPQPDRAAVVRPLAADPARRPPALPVGAGLGGAAAVLVLAAEPAGVAGRAVADPGAEALALAPLRPRRRRLPRLRPGRHRPTGSAAPALLRPPALLAVPRPHARLRPTRHQAVGLAGRPRRGADPALAGRPGRHPRRRPGRRTG